ncbi:hypothetical protein ACN4EK_13655 [Pantanalinema rosaneae CENA516]|uniref:hypothetical protein n=1 Tax=Pantanalinema rosaneae TaxID=1620701 RepID=UPI003D6EA839
MNSSLSTSNSPVPKAQPVQYVVTHPGSIESPSTWMQYGTSPTEIILATAVVIGAIAGVIGSLALLLQVLVPVMQGNSTPKRK